MYQVAPDWSKLMSVRELETELGLVFCGPGFYCVAESTAVIVPRPPTERPLETTWNKVQPEGTLYEVHMYNQPFWHTIFGSKQVPPTRN